VARRSFSVLCFSTAPASYPSYLGQHFTGIQLGSKPPLSTETMLPFHAGFKGTSHDIEVSAMYPFRLLNYGNLAELVCGGFSCDLVDCPSSPVVPDSERGMRQVVEGDARRT
jgi:hypothetical protein